VLEDWIWHAALPLVAYAGLAVASGMLLRLAGDALFLIGAVALLLLFIGIHNAWDTVTYLAIGKAQGSDHPRDSATNAGHTPS
jgi:hypothetical protein